MRETRASRPLLSRGQALARGVGPGETWGETSRSAGVGPEPVPAKAGGTGPYSERIRSGRVPSPHLTQRERHHHRQRQTDAHAHPGQAPEEVPFELEAAVEAGVDPLQGRRPTVAALPCGAGLRAEANRGVEVMT